MSKSLISRLEQDIRFVEAAKSCMNCGICTAICPAAEYFDYDPRTVINTVKSGDEEKLQAFIENDYIWYCGQCMSCKTRCPRNNCPGMVISALRQLSQETGAFIKSRLGRQQYLIKQTVGKNILKYGYCIHPTSVIPDKHPEQGPVWQWVYKNMDNVYPVAGGNLDKPGPGALRKIPQQSIDELNAIFAETGGISLFNSIENYSRQKAVELGLGTNADNADMDGYEKFVENEQ